MNQQEQYQKSVGQFFDHIRIDVTFLHESDRKSLEPVLFYDRWLTHHTSVLLVKKCRVFIGNQPATQFQVTTTSDFTQLSRLLDKVVELADAYHKIYGHPVIIEQSPVSSTIYRGK